MKPENYIHLLKSKTRIQQLETVELKSVVDEFPYFQSARALHLKGLKNQDSFKYNNDLKITAAYTTDRTVLFDFITSKEFINEKENIHQQINEKIYTIKTVNSNSIINNQEPETEVIEATEENKIEKVEEKLEIGKPIAFKQSEDYSFHQWLQLSAQKPIERKEKITSKTSVKEDIIEKFIQTNPKIEPISKDKSINISVSKIEQDSMLMTETLAKVYLEQKKYDNAMQAYRILSLKYPEKSGFFADQIKRVEILQKNKS